MRGQFFFFEILRIWNISVLPAWHLGQVRHSKSETLFLQNVTGMSSYFSHLLIMSKCPKLVSFLILVFVLFFLSENDQDLLFACSVLKCPNHVTRCGPIHPSCCLLGGPAHHCLSFWEIFWRRFFDDFLLPVFSILSFWNAFHLDIGLRNLAFSYLFSPTFISLCFLGDVLYFFFQTFHWDLGFCYCILISKSPIFILLRFILGGGSILSVWSFLLPALSLFLLSGMCTSSFQLPSYWLSGTR